jgi:hypothetical protein
VSSGAGERPWRPDKLAAVARRSIIAVVLLALVVAGAGCGRVKHRLEAKNEGLYLNIGPLLYQVQISRQLNPRDTEDRAYVQGLSPADAKLKPDEVLFAVFMRVQNPTNKTQPAARDYEITDTQDKRFTPLALPRSNVFSYQARDIAPQGLLPASNSAAATGVIGQGSALIFKVTLASLANRPLVLHIQSPKAPHEEGAVDLDV